MFTAFGKRELEYYDIFHQDKDYGAEARALPLKGKTILEIGSGTGLMTKELRELGYHVITIEPTDPDSDYPQPVEEFVWWYGKEDSFDNIIALYDVLNYVKPADFKRIKYYASDACKNFMYQIWPAKRGVKFYTHKKVENCHRVRIGIKLWKTAHLWFIYWGKGLCITKHKLYLHED